MNIINTVYAHLVYKYNDKESKKLSLHHYNSGMYKLNSTYLQKLSEHFCNGAIKARATASDIPLPPAP